MLKVAPPEIQSISSGPPGPIATFSKEGGYFDAPKNDPSAGTCGLG